MRKFAVAFLNKIRHISNVLAIAIIISAGILLAYALPRGEPSSLFLLLVYNYSVFALVVLIFKSMEWGRGINDFIRRKNPAYDRFWENHVKTMNAKGRVTRGIYITLRILTVMSAVASLLLGQYNQFVLAVFTLLLFTLPDIIQKRFAVRLPSTLESIIYCFIFAAEVLGEINNFYGLIPGWDTMLHTINGFLCAAIGFAVVYMLNRNSRHLHLSPLYLALTAFCFSMTVGVLWEFIEYFGDQFFPVDMQKDTIVTTVKSILINPTGENVPVILKDIHETTIGLAGGETFVVQGGYLDIGIVDTMKDLFVNFIGAVVFSFFGYFYVRQRDDGRKNFAERFIPVVEPIAQGQESQA